MVAIYGFHGQHALVDPPSADFGLLTYPAINSWQPSSMLECSGHANGYVHFKMAHYQNLTRKMKHKR